MRARILGLLAFILAAIGLAASIASLVDYLGPVPTFCAASGCATVRASAWSHPLGVPLPVLGIAFFAAMVALASRPKLWRALAIAGGAWALALIGLQAFAIGAWCKLCMIADPAAVLLAIVVCAGAERQRVTWRAGALAAGLAAATVMPVVLAHDTPPPVPDGTPPWLAREQRPGEVTVVEIVDFECPFCRAMAPELADAIARATSPVRVIRKMMPLAQHPHAMDAALAWCCADAQGKGEAMAAALFAAPPDQLTREGCEQIASHVGCDVDRYRRDLPEMSARVAADVRDLRAAGVHSLPTVFIAGQRFIGASAKRGELLAAINRAAR